MAFLLACKIKYRPIAFVFSVIIKHKIQGLKLLQLFFHHNLGWPAQSGRS